MKHRSEGACSMSCIILCYGKHDMLTWCDASKVTLCWNGIGRMMMQAGVEWCRICNTVEDTAAQGREGRMFGK